MKNFPAASPMLKVLGLIALAWLGGFSVRLVADESSADSFSERSAIGKRLGAAQAELERIPGQEQPELRGSLQELAAACQYHLTALDLLAAAQDALSKTRQESSAWKGFPEPPPYSVLLLDEVRESIAFLDLSEQSAKARLRIYKAEVEGLRKDLANHQQAERRLTEEAERVSDPELPNQARMVVKLEELSARTTAEKIGRRQLIIATEQATLDTIVVKRELAARQLGIIGGKAVFRQADLEGILQQISREREKTARALVDNGKDLQASDLLLTWKIEFLDLQKTFWENRFAATNSENPTEAREAAAILQRLESSVDDWVNISELRLSGGDSETTDADPAMLRDALLELRRMQRRIGFAINDLKGRSLQDQGLSLRHGIISTLEAIWDAELYLVEESEIVDGRRIAVYNAVTVGKLVRLAMILVIGWFVLRFLSRWIAVKVARRENVPQATADLAGKWSFGVGLALLLLYGLNRVSIPVTVFAFLGGALAIGLGFGTQTLLKNFISGIILLFERPLKIGDVIEVAGITGAIKFIGIRASVIQHFDGIVTLVPNSILLENELTNWNFSNTAIRHSIVVGVAYGSPTREVSNLLLEVAAAHGLVKKDPVPEVRFEDFAENSLTFSLLFWFDTLKTNRSTLASDLRFMIDKAFAEAGIVIAFPQRDLHLETTSPIRIQMVPGTTENPS